MLWHMPMDVPLIHERHVKLFKNGRNQAVRIPREFELPGEDAIMRIGPRSRRVVMRYLLDTNVISDLVRKPQRRIAQHIREVGEAQVCTSIIVAAELRYGATKKGSPRLTAQLEACSAHLTCYLSRRQPTPLMAHSALASNRLVRQSAGTICSSRLRWSHSAIPSSPTMSGSSGGLTSSPARTGCVKPDELPRA
jgi:predicted nucleic acid-binding protein